MAVRGQPITILANVTDDSGLVKSVTLFYSPSKDAAPFRSPMKSSGTSLYYGTIPAGVISSASSISYYIEALDYVDAAQETAWHAIQIKDPSAPEKTVSTETAERSRVAGAGGRAERTQRFDRGSDRGRSGGGCGWCRAVGEQRRRFFG